MAIFPKYAAPPPARMMSIVEVFSNHLDEIASPQNRLTSNDVLAVVASDLESAGFLVERGKKKSELLEMPVLFKEQGKIEKPFGQMRLILMKVL